jgi:hAT family protein
VFSEMHRDEMGQFFLVQDDWEVLKWLAQSLEVFWTQTLRLQGKAKYGHHGAIWEALPAMEYLLEHLEQLKARTPPSEPRLWECVNNAWQKMMKYYKLTDKSHQLYAAATFLNPTQRRDFFDTNWTGELQPWVLVMLGNCREFWEQHYEPLAPRKKMKTDAFEEWLYRKNKDNAATDEFSRYSTPGSALPASDKFNPISWWSQPDSEAAFPSLQRWAFDTLSCPATSCECERVFSSAKKLITPERNKLADDIIEALECLKAWWDNGFVERQ